jgi:hypothetical protein
MKRSLVLLSLLLITACSHLPGRLAPNGSTRAELWHDAHVALYREDFARADSLFSRLAAEHPDAVEGREARFYVGAVNLDPRNRDWNPERAETEFHAYLQQDTVGGLIHRRPEATTMLEVARQLNLPPAERVAGLRGGGSPGDTVRLVERRVAPEGQVRDLQEENERLRAQVLRREEEIRQQREELERIRRALQPRTPPE